MIILFILTGAQLFSYSIQYEYQYHFVSDRVPWRNAQTYCRETYTDLATVSSQNDMKALIAYAPANLTRSAWIGLERGEQWRWQWSFSDTDFFDKHDLSFRNWRTGHPNLALREDRCAVLEPNGKWFDDNCSTQRQFVCLNVSAEGDDTYVVVRQNKAWREALAICRETYTDLVTVRDATENWAIRTLAGSQVWIGLFSDPWVWSDQSNSSFRFWGPNQPNNVDDIQDCVVVRSVAVWNDVRCNSSRPFYCYSDGTLPVPTYAVSVAASSTESADRGTSQSHVHTLTTTGTQSLSQVFTSRNPQTIHSSTSRETTQISHQVSTSDQTQFEIPTTSHILYTGSSTTGEQLGLPQDQHTHKTKSSSTTHVSLHSTIKHNQGPITGTTAEFATSTSTEIIGTTENEAPRHTNEQYISSPFDALILIREEMSWMEALAYCMTNYGDLVAVSDVYTQRAVSEKVGNASTPYVWLGLRYSCKFSFWFWSNSNSVCYQNWAPEQESNSCGECGLAGAIQTSRGNQWFSLPDTQRLNFICVTAGL